MEDDYDVEELEIILGLKNKKDEITKIISDKKGLSFLGAISKILTNQNSNNLYEINEPELNQNEMLTNFSQKFGIDEIGTIKLKEYDDSNFYVNIKGDDNILHNSNINFTNEYAQKLKKDFVKKKEEVIQPIEIKSNNYNYNNNNKNYNKDKKKYNKYYDEEDKNKKPKKNYYENK